MWLHRRSRAFRFAGVPKGAEVAGRAACIGALSVRCHCAPSVCCDCLQRDCSGSVLLVLATSRPPMCVRSGRALSRLVATTAISWLRPAGACLLNIWQAPVLRSLGCTRHAGGISGRGSTLSLRVRGCSPQAVWWCAPSRGVHLVAQRTFACGLG